MHPAFLESAAPPAVSDPNPPDDPPIVDLSPEVSVGRENTRRAAAAQVHPAASATASPEEVLDEALAAALASYLKDFPPYARRTWDSKSDPSPSGSVGRESAAPPALPASAVPPALPEPTASDAMVEHPPPDFFITAHKRPASFPLPAAPGPSHPCPSELPSPETATRKPKLLLPEPPKGVDYCSAKAAELFHMTHGYPRDNPPKPIPNRCHDEDTRGFSLFREIKKFF